jgi:hypothetical protein
MENEMILRYALADYAMSRQRDIDMRFRYRFRAAGLRQNWQAPSGRETR